MKILDVPQSGSVGGVTSSRNRYGQYRRSRATPVNPNSSAQGAVRARLAAAAAQWRQLTANQRAGWTGLAQGINRTDSLGQSASLTGFSAFCSINQTLQNCGSAMVLDAPAMSTPDALSTLVVTLTAAAFSLAYTPTPLPVGAKLIVYCSPQRSAGRAFESDFRLVLVGGAAGASPLDIKAAYTAKFGVPVLGNRIFIRARVALGGFLSGPFDTSAVVA